MLEKDKEIQNAEQFKHSDIRKNRRKTVRLRQLGEGLRKDSIFQIQKGNMQKTRYQGGKNTEKQAVSDADFSFDIRLADFLKKIGILKHSAVTIP